MKAMAFAQYGGAEVLRFSKTPVPEISASEILVRVGPPASTRRNDDYAMDSFAELFD